MSVQFIICSKGCGSEVLPTNVQRWLLMSVHSLLEGLWHRSAAKRADLKWVLPSPSWLNRSAQLGVVFSPLPSRSSVAAALNSNGHVVHDL